MENLNPEVTQEKNNAYLAFIPPVLVGIFLILLAWLIDEVNGINEYLENSENQEDILNIRVEFEAVAKKIELINNQYILKDSIYVNTQDERILGLQKLLYTLKEKIISEADRGNEVTFQIALLKNTERELLNLISAERDSILAARQVVFDAHEKNEVDVSPEENDSIRVLIQKLKSVKNKCE